MNQPPGWGPQGQPPQYPQPQWGGPPPKTGMGTGAKVAIGAVVLIVGSCVACVGFGVIAGHRAAAPGGTSSTTAAADRQYVSESCSQVANTFSNNTNLTELQRGALWRERYQGRWVRWNATVNRVDRGVFGGLTMQFKCSPNSLLMDGHARFDSSQEAALMSYNQGVPIAFEGRLGDWGQFVGISIDDATVSR